MQNKEFPQEHLITLPGVALELQGRITIIQNQKLYDSQIDLVFEESGKIFSHIGRLFDASSPKEAYDLSYRKLKVYLMKSNR